MDKYYVGKNIRTPCGRNAENRGRYIYRFGKSKHKRRYRGYYGKNFTKENANWVHLEGTGGYFFPKGETLNMRKTNVNPSFFEMWINHGKNPKDAEYSYVLLPNKSAEETSEYSANPDITVISNTKNVQAVKEKNLNMTGYVFWESGELNGVGVSTPLILNITEDNDYVTINASDPTQKLVKSGIILDRKLEFAEGDFEAKSEITSSGTSIKLSLGNANGKTINIKLIDDCKINKN